MDFKVTYPEIGATRAGPLPRGYRHLLRSVDLDAPFSTAAEVLMTWGLHERCGLRPEATADRAAPGVEVTLRFAGLLRIPCQVVWAEEAPQRAGFGYGSMPGHPERGEAGFLLEAIDDRVRFSLRSFSVPGSTAARLGAPVARFLQSRATDQFVDTMREACSTH